MGKIPDNLRAIIARNIKNCRMRKYPGWGGGKRCAEAMGVSPQQWSPWECGKRTPDEVRLAAIAEHFGVTSEFLRRDHDVPLSLADCVERAEALRLSAVGAPFQNAGFPWRSAPHNPGSPESFYWLLDWLVCRLMQQGLTIRRQGTGVDLTLKAYLGDAAGHDDSQPPSTS